MTRTTTTTAQEPRRDLYSALQQAFLAAAPQEAAERYAAFLSRLPANQERGGCREQ